MLTFTLVFYSFFIKLQPLKEAIKSSSGMGFATEFVSINVKWSG